MHWASLVVYIEAYITSSGRPTSTKENAKDNKGKQVVTLVHVSPRRNPQKDKPTV